MSNNTHKKIVNTSIIATIILVIFADKFPEYKNTLIWTAGLVVLGATISHFKQLFKSK
jgi:hypothetical protein